MRLEGADCYAAAHPAPGAHVTPGDIDDLTHAEKHLQRALFLVRSVRARFDGLDEVPTELHAAPLPPAQPVPSSWWRRLRAWWGW